MNSLPMVKHVIIWPSLCLTIGLIIALAANQTPQERFSSYIAAKINRKTVNKPFVTKPVSVGSEHDLNFLQFSTPEVGIAGDHYGHLSLTDDGGETWQARDVRRGDQRRDVYFPSIVFRSANSGFAIAQEYNKPGEDLCLSQGSLLRTKDRGLSWQPLFTKKCVRLKEVSFGAEQEGWVIGSEFISNRGAYESRLLVLHSADNGETWNDVSATANRLLKERLGRIESPSDIIATRNSGATIVTTNGYVMDTSDGGVGWTMSTSLELHGLLPELKLTENGSVLVAGGIDGSHGTAGMIAARNDRHEWSGSWFKDIYLKDAIILSTSEILVCGSLLPEDKESLLRGEREGVVLYSSNSGRDWQPIVRSSEIRSINSLSKVGQRVIWAAAPRGQLIKITIP